MTIICEGNQRIWSIALIGDGQLAKMLIESLHCSKVGVDKSFVKVHVLASPSKTPNAVSPVSHLADSLTFASKPLHSLTEYDYTSWINAIPCKLDAFILETEHVQVPNLRSVLTRYYGSETDAMSHCWPNLNNLSIIQDKLGQRKWLKQNNIPQPDFFMEDSLSRDLPMEFPFVIKRRCLGYDGKGCYFIREKSDWLELKRTELQSGMGDFLVESFVDFKMECSVIVLVPHDQCDHESDLFCFPSTRTRQENGVCSWTVTPIPGISKDLDTEIQRIAKKVALSFKSHGIFAIEVFVTKDDRVLVNEIAPRVHNSGHYSIEACYNSQFDVIWKAIFGLYNNGIDTNLRRDISHAIMVNILGEDETADVGKIQNARDLGGYIHWYNKGFRKGRKMAHVTFLKYLRGGDMSYLVPLVPTITECSESLRMANEKVDVGIVMGSISDFKVMEKATTILEEVHNAQNVKVDVRVVSAHRTPHLLEPYVKEMEAMGAKVIIAGAGGAAHLPGMLASMTTIPIIGVPILASKISTGMDSILSILQMPRGVPVATVALDNAENAMILALQIIAVGGNEELADSLKLYKQNLISKVDKMNEQLQSQISLKQGVTL